MIDSLMGKIIPEADTLTQRGDLFFQFLIHTQNPAQIRDIISAFLPRDKVSFGHQLIIGRLNGILAAMQVCGKLPFRRHLFIFQIISTGDLMLKKIIQLLKQRNIRPFFQPQRNFIQIARPHLIPSKFPYLALFI